MEQKAIFLDIDGTLVDEHGCVPLSAREAVKRARANGHYVFICTGRASSEVVGEVAELELDGWVCAAGAYINVNGQIIGEDYIPEDEVKYLVDYMESHGAIYCLESPSGAYASKGTTKFFKEMMQQRIAKSPEKQADIEKNLEIILATFLEGQAAVRPDINKVTFFDIPVEFEEVARAFEGRLTLLPNSMTVAGRCSGELMINGIHKALGIQKVLKHLGLERDDCFAYGDGHNDLEMVQYAAIGIAMGNACKELKEVADDITDHVDQDGLYHSFQKYKLI